MAERNTRSSSSSYDLAQSRRQERRDAFGRKTSDFDNRLDDGFEMLDEDDIEARTKQPRREDDDE